MKNFQSTIVQLKKNTFLIITNIKWLKYYRIMFVVIKIKFIGFLSSVVKASNHIKYVSLNSQQSMTQSTVINLHPNKYGQGQCLYSFAVDLDRCHRSCNTLNDLYNKICVPKRTGG